MELFGYNCIYDDFIDVPVTGSFVSKSKVPFNSGEFTVNDLELTFLNTPSFLSNNKVDKDNVKFKPLCFQPNYIAGTVSSSGNTNNLTAQDITNITESTSNRRTLNSLYSAAIVDITTNNEVIAKATLWLVSTSYVTISSNVTNLDSNISGYFEGYVTLTGKGLLGLLPNSLKLKTSCTDIDSEFDSLVSSIRKLLTSYGNRTITRLLCDVVIKIPSMIIALSEHINDVCDSECKDVKSDIKNVLVKLKNVVDKFPITVNNIAIVYDVNDILSVLNRLFCCSANPCDSQDDDNDDDDDDDDGDDDSGKGKGKGKGKGRRRKGNRRKNDKGGGGGGGGGDRRKDDKGGGGGGSRRKDDKGGGGGGGDEQRTNVILKKLSEIESRINYIGQLTNNLSNKANEQDKIIRKLVDCVLKK